jgi:putative flavoprotein involved in K+ transport
VVLEQARLGESWRSHRWDSLRLVGANWSLQLPGEAYAGSDSYGFMPRDEVIAFIEAYARSFGPPLHEGIRATAVKLGATGRCFHVETTAEPYEADHVVIATGSNRVPRIPAWAYQLPSSIEQLPTTSYRQPGTLPAGAVLVVGSGESGCQISEELARHGRRVYLSAGRCWWKPAWYRGHDAFWWNVRLGGMEQSAVKGKGLSPQLTGQDGGRTLNLHTLARTGVTLLGHLTSVEAGTIHVAPDLGAQIAHADEDALQALDAIDAFVDKHGMTDLPPDDVRGDPTLWSHQDTEPIAVLDLDAMGVSTVIWATGYRLDFSWVRLPAFDADGYPRHEMGVATYPGLYFPALPGKDTFVGLTHDAMAIAAAIGASPFAASPVH